MLILGVSQTIFADNTFSKPFFVTYVNSTFFVIPLIPIVIRKLWEDPAELATLRELLPARFRGSHTTYSAIDATDDTEESTSFLKPNEHTTSPRSLLRAGSPSSSMDLDDDPISSQVLHTIHSANQFSLEKLTIVETARLSFEFCFLWFVANYFMASCLEYTTVASSTILTSTSSIWTLLIGTLWGVEIFTYKKLLGVLASLTGIMLISTVDLSGDNDKNRGSFPHKSPKEIAVGDAMAFFSAILYGLYAVVMKKRMGNEGRINMPLFFGMVGLLNLVLLWPGFVILHFVGLESFELPPTGRVLTIILVCFLPSFAYDESETD
jgi:solute carrier family 35 protein F5